MKIIKYILVFSVFSSCSRSILKTTTESNDSKITNESSIDTTKSKLITETSNTFKFGDKLKGGFFIPKFWFKPNPKDTPTPFVFIDSIESDGIKVKLIFSDTKTGYKANIEAIAKPVSITNTNKVTEMIAAGVTNSKVTATNSSKKGASSEVENAGFPWKLTVTLIILALMAIILIRKFYL